MRSIIILLLIILQVSSVLAKERASFYQNPNYENFIKLIEYDTEEEGAVSNRLDSKKLLLSVFITYVLDNYPEYRSRLSKDSAHYSKNKKFFLDLILSCQKTGEEKSKECAILREPSQKQLKFQADSTKELTRNMLYADFNWEAFYATGDKQYLIKILKFLSEQSLEVRTISLDMIKNGNGPRPMTNIGIEEEFDDKKFSDPSTENALKEWINKNDPKDQKHLLFKVVACYSVLYALNFNLQNPDISQKIAEIIKAQPELDYTKDVKL